MKRANSRSISGGVYERPSACRPRSIMRRAPPPIRLRAVANGTGGSPSWANTTLRVSTRSGAVSTSVPSRSKTTVAAGMGDRYRAARHKARAGPALDKDGPAARDRRVPVADVPEPNGSSLPLRGVRHFPLCWSMDVEGFKRAAAARALDFVRPGMRLGLGSGSTARHFVDLLGERVRAGLAVIGVPTSEATRIQAEELGIPLTTLDETPELDLTVDGADEIAPDLSLIKGGGGALLREKIVAAASARMIVIADQSKWVSSLGRFPLPIEAVPFGLTAP